MSADPLADPVPGEWYFGVRCSHCDEMVLVLPDLSGGNLIQSFEMRRTVERRCVRGHLTSFRLDELRQFQWRPRLNS